LLLQISRGLNMTINGRNGVVILSMVTYIDDSDCTAAGLQANASQCPNDKKAVFTQRLVIGNSTVRSSAFGTPNAGIVNTTTGNITTHDYLTDTSAVASGFSGVIPLSSGQYAYMAEMFVNSPDYSFGNIFGLPSVSSRSIF